ncbi:RNA-binding cell elongation regulator Jag/EloR [uncultured Megamonas sp.]|uniref:RNA-binding cell elongation regulator Jag/EloR n=1 Tax=uncultured Megamonas sp. TaxID=286140 RepID=UPI0026704FDB|nr:RNA-binding cell elongation regulator Jag/EloR [uncultured Megamonas sp.]
MARVIEVTGKDIEEAKKLALSQLNLPQERVIFEVLEEPSKGFFGLIGAREAKIRATEKELTPLEKGQEFLKKIFKSMHKDIKIECVEEDINYKFNLIGDDLGVLIGKHGQTLDSLQYLTNMAANKNVTGARVRIVLDVENYRKRREETLCQLAERLANKARKYRTKVVLEPMNRHERKIIHMALQDYADIITYSDGVEPHRKIVVDIKHNKNEDLVI